jgi:hypothetical protein
MGAIEGPPGQAGGAAEISSTDSLPSLGSPPPLGLTSAPPSGVPVPAFGMPFSASSADASTNSPGGIPTSASSSPSNSSSSSLFAQDESASSTSSNDDRIFAPTHRRPPPEGSIDVPFEIVVVCRQDDLLLHPGGYRLTTKAMKAPTANKDSLLVRELTAMVRKRAIVDPMIHPQPRLRFLIEANGSETYWAARRQLFFSLPDWPMSLQVSGNQDPHVFTKETW